VAFFEEMPWLQALLKSLFRRAERDKRTKREREYHKK
jgi:hypothetical protein